MWLEKSSSSLSTMLISLASKRQCTEVLLVATLERDPGLRPTISSYPTSKKDRIRKVYISKGSFQPQLSIYPFVKQGGRFCCFCFQWFALHIWLAYNLAKDVVYCYPCYLFAQDAQASRQFVSEGVTS